MKQKNKLYDTRSTGERIRSKRILLGLTQEELAEQIHRAPKYYSDIERGSCGMSMETMISIAKILDMSLDYMVFGTPTKEEVERVECQEASLTHLLAQCNERQHEYVTRMMQLLIASMSSDEILKE